MDNVKKYTRKTSADGGITESYEFNVPPMQQNIPKPVEGDVTFGNPQSHPGEPKGVDTIPAWLSEGEFVMNPQAVQMYGKEIEQMNNHGRVIQAAEGGLIPHYKADGGIVNNNNNIPTVLKTYDDRMNFLASDNKDFQDPTEKAAFLAQIYQESNGKPVLENLNYGKDAIDTTFTTKSRLQGISPKDLARNPEKLANTVYGGDWGEKNLGNDQKGDGWKYRGRGLIQITGKDNYKKYGDMIGVDLVNNPDLALQPDVSYKLAVAYWNTRVKPRVKDFNNTSSVTKGINPGLHGLKNREKYFNIYKNKLNEQPNMLQDQMKGFSEADLKDINQFFQQGGLAGEEIEPTRFYPPIHDSLFDEDNYDVPPSTDEDNYVPEVYPATPIVPAIPTDLMSGYEHIVREAPTDLMLGDEPKLTSIELGESSSTADLARNPYNTAAKSEMFSTTTGTPSTEQYGENIEKVEPTRLTPSPHDSLFDEDNYLPPGTNELDYQIAELERMKEQVNTRTDLSKFEKQATNDQIQASIDALKGQSKDTPVEIADPRGLNNSNTEMQVSPESKGMPDYEPTRFQPSPHDSLFDEDNYDVPPVLDEQEEEEKLGFFENMFGKEAVDRTKDTIMDTFDNMFDTNQLTTAAIMYLGQRALGYSHDGSLDWTAKNYAKQIQTKNAMADKLLIEGKHSPESVELYRQTGLAKNLKAKSSTKFDKETKEFLVNGKRIVGYWDKDTQKYYQRGDNGGVKSIPFNAKPYKDTGESYSKYGDKLGTGINSVLDAIGDKPDNFKFSGTELGNQATQFFSDKGFDISTDTNRSAMDAITYSAIRDMHKYAKNNSDKQVRLEPFLAKAIAVQKVGSDANIFAINPEEEDIQDIKYVSPKNIMRFSDTVEQIALKDSNSTTEARYNQNLITQKLYQAWQNLGAEAQSNYDPSSDENGFYVFAMKVMNDGKITDDELSNK